LDDQAIITRLKRGEIEALGLLVARYQARAIRAAYLVTHDSALAQDVVQSAFIRAYEQIHQFDTARPFAPWFLRSVVNAAVQAARREARHTSLEAALDAETALETWWAAAPPAPDAVVEQQERQQTIIHALWQLTPDQRAVIVLRYYLDYSEAEMAALLDKPSGTIKSRLHTARRRLGGLLRQVWPVEPCPVKTDALPIGKEQRS
jgi:RNA polymerase sigma-70 factor (ECF subfamily)